MSFVHSRPKVGQTEVRNSGLATGEVSRARDSELVVVEGLKSAGSKEGRVEMEREIWVDTSTSKSVSNGPPVELETVEEEVEKHKGVSKRKRDEEDTTQKEKARTNT